AVIDFHGRPTPTVLQMRCPPPLLTGSNARRALSPEGYSAMAIKTCPASSLSLHRRALLGGMGATAASLALPGPLAAFTSRSCASDLSNRIRIIDCSRDVTASARAIREAGVATVIRYYAREGGQWCGKVLSRVELTALHRAGLSVAVVFQHYNNQADFFYDE